MVEVLPVFRSTKGKDEYLAAYQAVLRRWPLPYEDRFIATRFGLTHVIVSGRVDGSPVVLLHPSGAGAAIWYPNAGPLGDRFRTFAVDIVGEPNRSTLTRSIETKNQCNEFSRWIEDLLGGLGVGRADFVGNSFGGFLALNTAIHLPGAVRKVVVISPAASFVRIPRWSWHFLPAMTLGWITGWDSLSLRPLEWIWQGFPIDDDLSRLRRLTVTAGRPRHGPPRVFHKSELRRIRAPVLLLIGEQEVIYDPERVVGRARRVIRDLETAIVPRGNHNAQYTASEFVNRRILEFLDK